MYSECVLEIVHTRLKDCSVITNDASDPTEFLKILAGQASLESAVSLCNEQQRVRVLFSGSPGHIFPQYLQQVIANGNLTKPRRTSSPDQDQTQAKVDVATP
jgi:hypothetical protein